MQEEISRKCEFNSEKNVTLLNNGGNGVWRDTTEAARSLNGGERRVGWQLEVSNQQ